MKPFLILLALVRVASAEITPVDINGAKLLFEHGRAHFEAGDYESALKEFVAARKAHALPAFDYNIGLALEQLQRPLEAAEAYRRYAASSPVPKDATEVIKHAEDLQKFAHNIPPVVDKSAATFTTTLTVTFPPPKRSSRLGPVLLGAGAIAALITGAALLGSAASSYGSLNSSCAPYCGTGSWSGLPEQEHAGEALLGAGGALAISDVVWWIVQAKRK